MNEVKIFFNPKIEFSLRNAESLIGITGLYFIFLDSRKILYPFHESRLIYIGMSEKRTNSIGNRLSDHFIGRSGNVGIINYKKMEKLFFTYFNFDVLKYVWNARIEDLESYFILDFVSKYGVYPICNNKTGFDVLDKELDIKLIIDWNYFE
jgi:hypothetical protein